MPVPYDFNAGDILVSTLRQAIGNLQGFMSYRGSQALANLRYYDNRGIGQGWIGKAYDDWARQFRQSQDVLNGYVYELDQHRVNASNTLYDTELQIYKKTQRTSLPFPSPPAQPPYAPNNGNSARNGVEGANPDCLYTYSKNTTSGSSKFSNDNLRPFFAKDLPGAAYASPTDGTAPGHSSVPELAQSITRFMRWSVLELDARVAAVGHEFAAADNYVRPNQRSTPQFITFSSPSDLNSDAQKDGEAAASELQTLRRNGNVSLKDYTALVQEVKDNQDDPAWTAGFFGNLSELDVEDLLRLMNNEKGGPDLSSLAALAQAYATAMESGQLKPPADAILVDVFFGDSSTEAGTVFNDYLLRDLQNSPQAAYQFLQAASGAQRSQLISGNYNGNGTTSDREAQMLNLAAAAMRSTTSPDDAQAFYNELFPLIQQTRPADPQTVLPAAHNFFGSYLAASTPPPMPGSDPEALSSWAQQFAHKSNADLNNWLAWINTFDKGQLSDQALRQNLEQLFLGIVVTGIDLALDAVGIEIPPLLGLGIALGSTLFTSGPAQWLDSKAIPITGDSQLDQNNMGAAAQTAAEYIAVVDAVAAGDVIGPDGNPVNPATLTDSDVQAIMAAPTLYQLRGDGNYENVNDMLNAVDAQFSYRTR